jgi:hypothetical protein
LGSFVTVGRQRVSDCFPPHKYSQRLPIQVEIGFVPVTWDPQVEAEISSLSFYCQSSPLDFESVSDGVGKM